MVRTLDFEGLSQELLSRITTLLPLWLPGGRVKGHEYNCGDLRGGHGNSLRININTGKWCDFATDERGGDLISLYAAINNLKQGEAAKQLADEVGRDITVNSSTPPPPKPAPEPQPPVPPADAGVPSMVHQSIGSPVGKWCYRNIDGQPLFYVARYDTPEGKQILPWSFIDGSWRCKGWPPPRPLYGLQQLKDRPTVPVLIVEGEKCVNAAKRIVGDKYAVISWPNGSKAVNKVDWSPLAGHPVLIWPDADNAGEESAIAIANILKDQCKQVKIISPDDHTAGWDAADALKEGWDWDTLKAWAVPRARVYGDTLPAPAQEPVKTENPNPETTAAIASKPGDHIYISINDQDMEILSGSLTAIHERLGLPTTQNGSPICNIDSCHRALKGIPELNDKIWFDEFYQRVYTTIESDSHREWTKIDTIKLVVFMQEKIGMRRVGKEMVHEAVHHFAHQTKRNEPKEWLSSLKWDETPRLKNFFQECFGAVDTDYVQAVGENFFVSMVARIFNPGCQVDSMVVLEGAQGVGKSKALEIIAGKWHVSSRGSIDNKDFYLALEGKLICEIAEMESFNKAEVTLIKQVITCRTDRYRTPYDDRAQDHPRQCVFVATTNENQWQRDNTGARRFWPVACQKVDLQKIRELREHLFAEAVHSYKAGKTWHITPSESTLAEQEARRQNDPWEPLIESYLNSTRLSDKVTVSDIAVNCLKMEISRIDMRVQRRIGSVLHTLGWDRRSMWFEGKTQRVWSKEGKDAQQTLEDLQED